MPENLHKVMAVALVVLSTMLIPAVA